MIIRLTRSKYGHLRGLTPSYDYIDICLKKDVQNALKLANTSDLVAYALINESKIIKAQGRDTKTYRKYYGYVQLLDYLEGKECFTNEVLQHESVK